MMDSTTSVLGTWLLYDLPDELMLEPSAVTPRPLSAAQIPFLSLKPYRGHCFPDMDPWFSQRHLKLSRSQGKTV